MSPWIHTHTHTSYYSFLFWISISVSVSATEMLGEKPVSRLALVTAWQSIGIVVPVLFFYFFRSLAFFRPLVAFMLMSSSSSSSGRRSIWLLPQLLTTRANKTVDCRMTLGHHRSLFLSALSCFSLSLSFWHFNWPYSLISARSLATFLFAATACSLYDISIYDIGSLFCI